ncbi:MAG: serine/threonine protein kinase [Proteobacteria bacterium]|nr:serine/threonine protein kinase [Cystobacterineae bacterium]MCL2314170.1 serine/threonine protein kinase [Pseudomonadota bacterium]
MNVQPGKQLGGYQLCARIAAGGQAEVFCAKATEAALFGKPRRGEFVVLKRLLPAFRRDARYVRRFLEEGRLMLRLKHPNIVETMGYFEQGKDCILVQEWVEGQTLERVQERSRGGSRSFPLEAGVFIVRQLLFALCYIHELSEEGIWRGLAHADLSPSNLLLSKEGEVKLIDFGVARLLGGGIFQEDGLGGTVAYMSPEVMLGHPADERADLYAVGVLLWELLANRRLFEGNSEVERMHKVKNAQVPPVTRHNPGVPFFAELILRKALAVHPERRFESARVFLEALDAWVHRMGLRQDSTLVAQLWGD